MAHALSFVEEGGEWFPLLGDDNSPVVTDEEGTPTLCCCKCIYIQDHFDRANVGSNYSEDSGTWSIDTGRLKGAPSSRITHLTPHPKASPDILARVMVELPAAGAKAQLYLGDWAVEIEAAGSGCGKLRILDNGSPVGPDAYVPGLTFGAQYNLRLCYNQAIKVFSVSVEVGATTHRHHARGVSITGSPLVGMGTGSTAGDYFFDDLVVQEVHSGSYYYSDPECPCCSGSCETEGVGISDCRWTGTSTSRVLRRSWSGLGFECQEDKTQRVAAIFPISNYGDEVELFVDWKSSGENHSAKLIANADEGFGTGFLKLFKNGGEIASTGVHAPPIPSGYEMQVCFDQALLTGVVKNVARLEKESDGNGGHFVGFEVSDVALAPGGVSVNHNLYESDCPDCIDAVQMCDDDDVTGIIGKPKKLLMTVEDLLVNPDDPNAQMGSPFFFSGHSDCCEGRSGTYMNEWTETLTPNLSLYRGSCPGESSNDPNVVQHNVICSLYEKIHSLDACRYGTGPVVFYTMAGILRNNWDLATVPKARVIAGMTWHSLTGVGGSFNNIWYTVLWRGPIVDVTLPLNISEMLDGAELSFACHFKTVASSAIILELCSPENSIVRLRYP